MAPRSKQSRNIVMDTLAGGPFLGRGDGSELTPEEVNNRRRSFIENELTTAAETGLTSPEANSNRERNAAINKARAGRFEYDERGYRRRKQDPEGDVGIGMDGESKETRTINQAAAETSRRDSVVQGLNRLEQAVARGDLKDGPALDRVREFQNRRAAASGMTEEQIREEREQGDMRGAEAVARRSELEAGAQSERARKVVEGLTPTGILLEQLAQEVPDMAPGAVDASRGLSLTSDDTAKAREAMEGAGVTASRDEARKSVTVPILGPDGNAVGEVKRYDTVARALAGDRLNNSDKSGATAEVGETEEDKRRKKRGTQVARALDPTTNAARSV